jgi:hypothetical protein
LNSDPAAAVVVTTHLQGDQQQQQQHLGNEEHQQQQRSLSMVPALHSLCFRDVSELHAPPVADRKEGDVIL